jgi:hypothetical protein
MPNSSALPKRSQVVESEYSEYQVELAERKDMPGAWTVEAIDDDGGIEQAIFMGPKAHERAETYRTFQYGSET